MNFMVGFIIVRPTRLMIVFFVFCRGLGQAGFRVVTVLVSEHCCDLVASKGFNIVYYMGCVRARATCAFRLTVFCGC